MSWHRRQEPVLTIVRGAYVKAVSPAERGRSEATRLDVGEHHAHAIWLDDAAGDHNILRSTRVKFPSVPRARQHHMRGFRTELRADCVTYL